MYNTLFSVALFSVTAVSSVLAGFSIDTPKFTQCEPATISWQSTKGPYNIYAVDANDPCGDVLHDFGDIKDTSLTWPVGFPTGAVVELYIEDGENQEAWSGPIHVLSSDNQACVPKSLLGHFNVSNPSKTPGTHIPHSSPPVKHASTNPATTTPTPTGLTNSTPTNATSTAPTSTSAVPIGAANAGSNPFKNGALSMHHVCTSLATIGAFIAAVALAL